MKLPFNLLKLDSKHHANAFLSSLLPEGLRTAVIGNHKELSQLLEAWRDVIGLSRNALIAFSNKEYSSFDAIVGDNRCEVRALLLMKLSHKMNPLNFETIRHFIDVLDKILNSVKGSKELVDKKTTFEELLQAQGWDIKLPKKLFLLIVLYGLTVVKVKGDDHIDRTCPKRLCNIYSKISSGLTKKLISKWQQIASKESILFLRNEAQNLEGEEKRLQNYLSDDYVLYDAHKRASLPISIGLRVVLESLLSHPESLMALKINHFVDEIHHSQSYLLFKYCPDSESIVTVEDQEALSAIESDRAVIVVEGCSINENKQDIIDGLKEFGPKQILLMNAAHKSEYPSREHKSASLDVHPNDFDIIKETANFREIAGFSLCNPSIFCISHVSTHTVKEALCSSMMRRPNYLPLNVNALKTA